MKVVGLCLSFTIVVTTINLCFVGVIYGKVDWAKVEVKAG